MADDVGDRREAEPFILCWCAAHFVLAAGSLGVMPVFGVIMFFDGLSTLHPGKIAFGLFFGVANLLTLIWLDRN